MKSGAIILLTFFLNTIPVNPWGFFGHRQINRLAIFTLPPEMMRFYKKNIDFIIDNSVNPDKRRYAIKEEASRHYIDLDVYPDSAFFDYPNWQKAVSRFGEDSLQNYGLVPWHIVRMSYRLTNAFINKDVYAILMVSTELGHYIGDSNVPLHTTENYNGQLTDQYGIHGFWESRLVESFFSEYKFLVGRANFVHNVNHRVWENIFIANNLKDSVLYLEKSLTANFPVDRKYSYETRGTQTVKVYSKEFTHKYHSLLGGMVERQMRRSVKMVGDIWYTCWVNAGQPNLDELSLINADAQKIDSLETNKWRWLNKKYKARDHEK